MSEETKTNTPLYSKFFLELLKNENRGSSYNVDEKDKASDFLIQIKYLLGKYDYFKDELITYHHNELGLIINTNYISEIYYRNFTKDELDFIIEKSNNSNILSMSDTLIEVNERRNVLITKFIDFPDKCGDLQALQSIVYELNLANRLITSKISDLNKGQISLQNEFSFLLKTEYILELIFTFTYFSIKAAHFFLKQELLQKNEQSLSLFLRNYHQQEPISRVSINLLPFKAPIETLAKIKLALNEFSIECHISTDKMALFIIDNIVISGFEFKTETIISLSQSPHLYTMLLKVEIISENFKGSNVEINMANIWSSYSFPNQGIEIDKDGTVGFFTYYYIDFEKIEIDRWIIRDYFELMGIVELGLDTAQEKFKMV